MIPSGGAKDPRGRGEMAETLKRVPLQVLNPSTLNPSPLQPSTPHPLVTHAFVSRRGVPLHRGILLYRGALSSAANINAIPPLPPDLLGAQPILPVTDLACHPSGMGLPCVFIA